MKKQNLFALTLICSIAVLAGCNQNDMEKQIQPEVKDTTEQNQQQETPVETPLTNEKGEVEKTPEQLIQEKFDEQEEEIVELTEEVQYYRTFVKDFTATFSSDEMQEFIEKEWTYQMTINDINFPKDGILELATPTFDLVMLEKKVPYSVIPDEMSEKGRIPDGLKGKLQIPGEIAHETTEQAEDTHSFVTYSFKDVPSKTVIKIQIPEDLQKELNMDTKDLEVHIQ